MPDIATLNRRITINQYSFAQDVHGGNIKTLGGSYTVWASVEQRSGSRTLDNLQVQYKEVYKIVKRYEASRKLNMTDEIVYESATLSIGNIREVDEGKKKFIEITAYNNAML